MSLFRALLFWALWFFSISIVRFCLHPHNLSDEYQIEMSILPYSLLYFSFRCSTALLLLLLGIFFLSFSLSFSVCRPVFDILLRLFIHFGTLFQCAQCSLSSIASSSSSSSSFHFVCVRSVYSMSTSHFT